MICDGRSLVFSVTEATQVGEARRAAANLADEAGLDEDAVGRLGILVTELATNLHKHAKEGAIMLRRFSDQHSGVEVMAIDKGPGMQDVEKCFRDGYSTSGTAGTGLGSVSRLGDLWDVYSVLGTGTGILAQVWNKRVTAENVRLKFGAVCVALKGERECGDNWAYHKQTQYERVMVADGLGHGHHAAEASEEAEQIFRESKANALPELIQAIHNALRKTRGAAVAIAEFDLQRRVIRYVGVGNISATILHNGTTRSLVSQNGTVGHEARRIQEFQYPWPEGATLVMNSDGLLSKWELSKYPGLLHRHPSLLAGVLWRDFTRGRDDVTVLAVRDA